jgi:uncharacterized protein YndB with AHSA1/START domain
VATATTRVNADPEAVWRVLSDGWTYAQWVVGTSHVRAVDAKWPEAGSRLHHAVGVWPFVVRDHTEVMESDPQQRLLLSASGWPFGEAEVDFRLEPDGSGTKISLIEHGKSGAGLLLNNPVGAMLIERRNVETLARLSALVHRQTDPTESRPS